MNSYYYNHEKCHLTLIRILQYLIQDLPKRRWTRRTQVECYEPMTMGSFGHDSLKPRSKTERPFTSWGKAIVRNSRYAARVFWKNSSAAPRTSRLQALCEAIHSQLTWGICTRKAGNPYKARSQLYSFSAVSKPTFANKCLELVGKLLPRSTQCTTLHLSLISEF